MTVTRFPQAKHEREVIAALRRHKADRTRADASEAERDRVIRDALARGLTQERIAELTREHGQPLTQGRISQIKRGIRR